MEEIDGIKVFTERLEYWRFIQGFEGDLHPDDGQLPTVETRGLELQSKC